ncbi:MAG TPA: BamA/TamA family outer membrane protein [candidate division Zixibacteria bacterium]
MRKSLKIFLFVLVALLAAFSGASSQERYFGKNKVQYSAFDWYYIQSDNFDIYYYGNGYGLAKYAAKTLENAYQEVRRQLKHTLTKKIPVIIYNCPKDFQQTNVTYEIIEEGIGGFTESFKTRVVVPFDGSYEDFRHVLHHELTHAVMFNKLYGDLVGALLTRQYLFQVPLWFSEGFAEYSSRHGWDLEADMIMRDATINGYLVPLDLAGGYLVYKEGQSALVYIVKKYSEDKIAEILSQGRRKLSFNSAMEAALGLTEKQFSEEWTKYLKREYWPEIADRQEPQEFAKQLTDHLEDGSYLNEKPEFSPDGDKLAIFSDRRDYTEVYIISSVDGRLIKRLVKAERSGDLESLHSYVSGLAWSPDGYSLAFVSRSGGQDKLFLVRFKNRKIYKKLKFDLDEIVSPSWSPSEDEIAFVGLKDGESDLYVYNLESKQLFRITRDPFEEAEPSWSPDGKFMAFSSDRPTTAQETDTARNLFTYHTPNHNLFVWNKETNKIAALTSDWAKNTSPSWSPDGRRICFVSNRNGIDNLYILDIDSLRSYPITNVLTACFSPSWSKAGDKIAFSSFNKGGWDIFVLKGVNQIEPKEPLTETSYLADLEADTLPKIDTARADTSARVEDKLDELDLSAYVFKSGERVTLSQEKEKKEEVDTSKYIEPEGEYRKNKYKLRFTPDLVSGSVGYDPFYGLSGQSYLMISDIFGNHTILLATDLINTIDQTNFELYYVYLPKRIDYGIAILHTKYYYVDDYDNLFSDRVYGGFLSISRPFNKFSRLELNISHLSVDREYEDPPGPGRSTKSLITNLSLINDTVLWGITGPINGRRTSLSFNYSPIFSRRSAAFRTWEMDCRNYWHFFKRYSFAFRLASGASYGRDPQRFFLGGTSNWISPKLAAIDVYGLDDLYFGEIVTPLRGYDYYDVVGTRYALLNLEFRYPFVENLTLGFPLRLSFHYITGAMFCDFGAAWNQTKKFKGATTKDGTRLNDIKAGVGFGARVNLGIFVLRFDSAWKTDFNDIAAKPINYFSLGAEF